MDNPVVRLLSGKQIVSPDPALLAALRAPDRRTVLDVGTGDARMAYRLARAHPEWLVIGLDPHWRGMVDTAVRSNRKAARGGVANLLLVVASIESPPPELTAVADEVLVLMPWGRLLHGLVHGDPEVCGGLRRVARTGATVDLTVGTSIWRPPVPVEIRELPELTTDYVHTTLSDRWARAGLRITETGVVTGATAAGLATSWARRLGSTGTEQVMHVRAVAEPVTGLEQPDP
jgi:16S rRNA (adenine(1408)-N(1))-methyltransferase